MPPKALTVAELEAHAEGELGVSEWLPMGQWRIDEFANATEDPQWVHVDPARAAEGPFGTTIAHGYLTLSLLPRLLKDVIEITDQKRGANYGIDRVRFTAPVRVDDAVRLRARLTGTERRADGGLLYKIGFELEISDRERPALVGEVLYVTYPS